jgi:hypothetical protein
VLALAYWRLRDVVLLLPWSIICLILSGVHLVFAERLRTWRFKDKFYRRAFGVHALACAGFLAAAVPLWVEREWLPVLWSLLLPLTAWIANKIEEPWAAARAVGRGAGGADRGVRLGLPGRRPADLQLAGLWPRRADAELRRDGVAGAAGERPPAHAAAAGRRADPRLPAHHA